MHDERIIITSQDLESRYEEISGLCAKANKPVFIECDGKIDLVIMSIKHYKEQGFDEIWPMPDEI